MGDEPQEGEEKRRIPRGCRLNEAGEIICPQNAPRELKPEIRDGALFKNAPVQFKNIRCRQDKRTGKMNCTAEFETDTLPEA